MPCPSEVAPLRGSAGLIRAGRGRANPCRGGHLGSPAVCDHVGLGRARCERGGRRGRGGGDGEDRADGERAGGADHQDGGGEDGTTKSHDCLHASTEVDSL